MVIIVFITSLSLQAIAKKAAIVIDFDTKEVLFETNADTKNYPASLTKMMTLYIVFDFRYEKFLGLNSTFTLDDLETKSLTDLVFSGLFVYKLIVFTPIIERMWGNGE